MNAQTERLCAWSGLVAILLFGGGLGIAGFIPPPSPDDGPAEIAELFREDQHRIIAGLQIGEIGAALFIPFYAAVAMRIWRGEAGSPTLALTQFGGGLATVTVLIFPLIDMVAAAYRSDRDPALVQGLNDLGFLPLLGVYFTVVVQCLAVAVAVFQDQTGNPAFPRWMAYLSVWVAILVCPDFFVPFFTTGPLAWDGIFAFWLPAAAFFVWNITLAVLLLSGDRSSVSGSKTEEQAQK